MVFDGRVPWKRTIKLLGVIIKEKDNFTAHVDKKKKVYWA